MNKLLSLFIFQFLLFTFHFASAQNVGIGTNTPNPSAQLDVTSTTRGFLPPRMTFVQRNTVQNPATGLIVYCTDCGARGELQMYNGVSWTNIIGGVPKAATPSLSTTNVSSITETTATTGGNVTSDGTAAVTARGVVWSTSTNPTVALTTKTIDGAGIGAFTSNINGLTASTIYYVRAYATNSAGTAYGNEVRFKTSGPPPPPNSVIDVDDNVYPTVTIGSQVWMAENLRTTKYNDGVTEIPLITNDAEWASNYRSETPKPMMCWYNNDKNTYFNNKMGALYNWYAINPGTNGNRNVCPTGWHVSTDADWTTLTTFLGGENVAGGKLKSTGTQYWQSPNTGATNSSGFSGLPGGTRGDFGGSFYANGFSAYWWSSTESSNFEVWTRYQSYSFAFIERFGYNKAFGFSVRCVKD